MYSCSQADPTSPLVHSATRRRPESTSCPSNLIKLLLFSCPNTPTYYHSTHVDQSRLHFRDKAGTLSHSPVITDAPSYRMCWWCLLLTTAVMSRTSCRLSACTSLPAMMPPVTPKFRNPLFQIRSCRWQEKRLHVARRWLAPSFMSLMNLTLVLLRCERKRHRFTLKLKGDNNLTWESDMDTRLLSTVGLRGEMCVLSCKDSFLPVR